MCSKKNFSKFSTKNKFGPEIFLDQKVFCPKENLAQRIEIQKSLGPDTFQTHSRHPQDTLKTSSRHPPDTLQTPSRHPLSLKCPNMPVLEVQRVAGWVAGRLGGWLAGWLAGWIWDHIAKLQLGLSLASYQKLVTIIGLPLIHI